MSNYITELDADTYFQGVLFTDAWDDASSIDKVKALTMATKMLDLLGYSGFKTDDAQENEFPRDGDTEIPTNIQEACADIALVLLNGKDMEEESENLGVISQGYANVKATYSREFVQEYIRAGIPSNLAWKKIKPYLANPEQVTLNRV